MYRILSFYGGGPPLSPPDGFKIAFNPHGIRGGWCMWPLNFDPVWVKCEMGESQHKASAASAAQSEREAK